MKRVYLHNQGPFKAVEVITSVLELPSQNQGINYKEMQKRVRVLDVIEAAKSEPFVDLEDADHEHLVQLLHAFQFATARPELLQILNQITNARAPDALRVVDKEPA